MLLSSASIHFTVDGWCSTTTAATACPPIKVTLTNKRNLLLRGVVVLKVVGSSERGAKVGEREG